MTGCVHRWQIAEANGAMSKAICSKCGEKKILANSLSGLIENGLFTGKDLFWRLRRLNLEGQRIMVDHELMQMADGNKEV